MRKTMLCGFLLLPLLAVAIAAGSDDSAKIESAKPTPDSAVVADSGRGADQVIATYFHGDRRCATCLKLESYSKKAIEQGFADLLKDSALVWRTVNYDADSNKHYLEQYQLYTKAVILSRVRNGKELAWKNLDKIWDLVGDETKFVAYIQEETRTFLNPPSEK